MIWVSAAVLQKNLGYTYIEEVHVTVYLKIWNVVSLVLVKTGSNLTHSFLGDGMQEICTLNPISRPIVYKAI